MNSIARHYTEKGTSVQDVIDGVNWTNRHIEIINAEGTTTFVGDASFPDFWSDSAAKITASRYFYRGTEYFERSFADMVLRITGRLAQWLYKRYPNLKELDKAHTTPEPKESAKEIFMAELAYIMIHQIAAFNSPVYFNLGISQKTKKDHPELCSACFLVGIDDDMHSIKEFQNIEFDIFKSGAGSGSNFSKLRASMEHIKGGGTSSGPISFMEAMDAWAGRIRSGGRLRRAAIMRILDVDHPDIAAFISSKVSEEEKAWALMNAGYSGGIDGEAYRTVSFQNENHSVRVSDQFMRAVVDGKEFPLQYRKDTSEAGDHVHEMIDAQALMQDIAESAWKCGDPGLHFKDIINASNTIPETGEINTSNPCSEVFNIDDTSCNLASINLIQFINGHSKKTIIDFASLRHVVEIMVLCQDLIVDYAEYPHPRIKEGTQKTRNIGLGITNLGNMIMQFALPYDSNEARFLAASVMGYITAMAYQMSNTIGNTCGSFPCFEENRQHMADVLSKHAANINLIVDMAEDSDDRLMMECKEAHTIASRTLKSVASDIRKDGAMANCYVTSIAPTGTISFMMDATTTGMEPELALIKYKTLVNGDVMKIMNNTVISVLADLGYTDEEIEVVNDYILEHNTIDGAPHVKKEHYRIFQCSFGENAIPPDGHLLMLAALQPVVSQGISKTVNLPEDTSVDDIVEIYIKAWKLDLKCISVYRDNSKNAQPLTLTDQEEDDQIGTSVASTVFRPYRRPMPIDRKAMIHKFTLGTHEGYLAVGLYPDGKPGEIFITMAKAGTFTSGIIDCFATTVSIGLQYGVPLKHFIEKFKGTKFEPMGWTGQQDIRFASSVVDYVGKWLEHTFITPKKSEEETEEKPEPPIVDQEAGTMNGHDYSYNICPCGGILMKSGTCEVCEACGETTGCS